MSVNICECMSLHKHLFKVVVGLYLSSFSCPVVQVSRCPGVQLSRCTVVQVSRCPVVKVSRNQSGAYQPGPSGVTDVFSN